MQRKLEA